VLLTGVAAGLGWGIRGQYGHETGAMIAGVLASLTLVLWIGSRLSSLAAARAAALMTVAIGIGGSMTYGQTIGLTHDAELVGNWHALGWGMLGLSVKGAIWIGYAGAFLGVGLGGMRYRPGEMARLLAGLLALMFLGSWLINSPFDPASKTLPWVYFSDDWYFEPGRELEPRPEVWGGLLLALAGLGVYVRLVRGDRLAGRMLLVGLVAGGIGFPAGQCVQTFARWNPELFGAGALSPWQDVFRHVNWWNMMETTFGLVWGAILAAGLWSNRHLVVQVEAERAGPHRQRQAPDPEGRRDAVSLSVPGEVFLCSVHLLLLLSAEFLRLSGPMRAVGMYTQFGLLMSALPIIGIVGGRCWPYLMLLPVVAAPIAGKTLRELSYRHDEWPVGDGWFWLVGIPLAVTLCAAVWLIGRSQRTDARVVTTTGGFLSAAGLLLTTALYYAWNTVFFRGGWPWREWTGRTPNQAIFTLFALCLIVAASARLAIIAARGRAVA
jgi:hypothetical protein